MAFAKTQLLMPTTPAAALARTEELRKKWFDDNIQRMITTVERMIDMGLCGSCVEVTFDRPAEGPHRSFFGDAVDFIARRYREAGWGVDVIQSRRHVCMMLRASSSGGA